MSSLVPSPKSWLDRPSRVGTPRHWAKSAGLLGVVLGGVVPAALLQTAALFAGGGLPPLAILMFYSCSAAAGGAAGALLGLLQPAFLDRVRGWMPLPAIAVLEAGQGALAGAAATGSWLGLLWLMGMPAEAAFAYICLGLGAAVGVMASVMWWLPFTISTVLGRSWPVTSAVAVGLPTLLSGLLVLLLLLL
jgi:hypothetical protein